MSTVSRWLRFLSQSKPDVVNIHNAMLSQGIGKTDLPALKDLHGKSYNAYKAFIDHSLALTITVYSEKTLI